MSTPVTVSAQFGAHPITIETGKLAKLADGAVTVRYGDTLIIVTAVSATKIKEGQDFFPPHRRVPRARGRGRQDPRRLL